MTDSEYIFNQTSFERKRLARGAFSKVNGSRSKYCKLNSDNMTRAQWKKENGIEMSYNLSKPMNYSEFKKMPSDLQKEYLHKCLFEHKGRATDIAEMMGADTSTVNKYIVKYFGKVDFPMKHRQSISDEWVAFACEEALCEATSEDKEIPVEENSVPEAAPCVFKNESVPTFSIDSGAVHISGDPYAVLAKFLKLLEVDAEYSFDIKFRKEVKR